MPDMDLVAQNIRTLLATVLGLDPSTVRPANQNGPTGNLSQPFVTVLVTDITEIGIDETTMVDQGVDGELVELMSGWRRIIASVQFFRQTNNFAPKTIASRLQGLLRGSVARMHMNHFGLGLVRVGHVTDLSQVVDAYFEQRAQVELEFTVSSVEQAIVPTFAGVNINVKLDSQNEVNLDVAP